MNILGINAYHGDASAALVVDGQLVAAVKRNDSTASALGRLSIAVDSILPGLCWHTPEQIDHVAVSFNPRANLFKRLAFVATHWPSTRAILDRLSRQKKTLGLEDQLAQGWCLAYGDSRTVSSLGAPSDTRGCGLPDLAL